MCKSRELRSSEHSAGSVGVVLIESEWYCSLLLSAMYAGLFALNEGHFFYCEGPPCTFYFTFTAIRLAPGTLAKVSTAPLSFWSVFDLLVIKLSSISSPIRFRIDFVPTFFSAVGLEQSTRRQDL